MISSVDPSKAGTALMAQSDTAPFTKLSSAGTTQQANTSFLPMSTTSTTGSITDTLNGIMTMLQNLLASISTMFGGNNGGNPIGTPGAGDAGRFDFLRPVDEEPPTVITTNKTQGPANLGEVSFDNEAPTQVDKPKEPTKTGGKKKKVGTKLKKSNGEFLWKPKSDKDGKLAILLPKGLTGKVADVQILSPDGTQVIGKGKYAGVGNGEREHYRFGKAGGSFPDGAIVVITMQDGSKRHVEIKETSDRTTR